MLGHIVLGRFVNLDASSSASVGFAQTADFGPRTAIKIVDMIREGVKTGKVKTADDMRAALKVRRRRRRREAALMPERPLLKKEKGGLWERARRISGR